MTGQLDIRDLTVRLGGHDIVRDLTLNVPAGDIVGLLGPNGSGKSTLLRTVYRSLTPHAGALVLDGDDLTSLSLRDSARRVAALAQDSSSDLDFTVEEIVRLGRSPHQDRGRRLTTRELDLADTAMDRLGVSHLRHRGILSLSGGERQRVLIARALVQEPTLLVLDEPTNHLDITHQLRLLSLLRGGTTTVLAVLHDINLAAAACDRIYLLHDGRIVASGTPAEVITTPIIRQVYDVDVLIVEHPVTGRPQILHTLEPLERTR
ncbi:Ferric enterobactin transport ATP-binding protein FepC [Austwickia sp. TVS 96-490-7B]|uniref:ABC transporter ATP-binding protein n=1 Tax=Austwickia sp. TVS 96-490-7B TaxID=2830843 RepID=UPI001C5A18B1|nr:ABC transporter ATP-binding protein [Austwickia sp. TVS 96-490-7B]MBW3085617.1 Ferric enterobactin transport ATP-binding protein FepC [Austwickia sp. TVS 96-490-7B]